MLPIIISTIENPEDHELMTEFYMEHHAFLYREARKHLDTPEDVEDIVYETLVKIIEKIHIFRDLTRRQQIKYALTTTKNLAYIYRKRKNYFTIISLDEMETDIPADNSVSAEDVVSQKLQAAYVKQVWSQLDMDTRMLLEQKYILHWTDEELASLLGIKPQSVRMRLTRAKRALFAELTKRGFSLSDL